MADLKYGDLNALFINTTLTKSPETSHTQTLIDMCGAIMEKQGVSVESFRAVDYTIAPGVQPNMRKAGWDDDAWPELWPKVKNADILVLAGPIWLGDNSSEMKKIIERLYAHSAQVGDDGLPVYYQKVGGALFTGNEDGLKHCAMNVLYSLGHIGYTIPPDADAGWLGEIGPGPSYGDKMDDGSHAGFERNFTNQNTTFLAWNLMHMAAILKQHPIPAHGNVPSAWEDGERFGFEPPQA